MLPFILRSETLAGIDSMNAPQDVRIEAWSRLAHDLDLEKLGQATQVVARPRSRRCQPVTALRNTAA